jgi:outer membrane lipoprotein-sorting protein
MFRFSSTPIALLMIMLFAVPVCSEDARTIVEKADQKMRGNTSIAEMSMKIIRPDWSREVTMKSWTKGTEYALILITAPDRDRGTTFLKRGNEVWQWVPSVERVIKMPPSMMMQSWMGSDFTNDDLVKESSIVKDYTHKIAGDSTIRGRDCYKIELTPKPDAPVVWGRLYLWVSKKDYLQLRIEFYDEDMELKNVMILSEIKEMGGRVIPTVLEMMPADEPDHKTVITYYSIEFNKPIEESFFSEQNMKRVR